MLHIYKEGTFYVVDKGQKWFDTSIICDKNELKTNERKKKKYGSMNSKS